MFWLCNNNVSTCTTQTRAPCSDQLITCISVVSGFYKLIITCAGNLFVYVSCLILIFASRLLWSVIPINQKLIKLCQDIQNPRNNVKVRSISGKRLIWLPITRCISKNARNEVTCFLSDNDSDGKLFRINILDWIVMNILFYYFVFLCFNINAIKFYYQITYNEL